MHTVKNFVIVFIKTEKFFTLHTLLATMVKIVLNIVNFVLNLNI